MRAVRNHVNSDVIQVIKLFFERNWLYKIRLYHDGILQFTKVCYIGSD